MHGREISGSGNSASASALEKRSTFALHLRIHDEPTFTVDHPSDALLERIGCRTSRATGARQINIDFLVHVPLCPLTLTLLTQCVPRHLILLHAEAHPQRRIDVFCIRFAMRPLQHTGTFCDSPAALDVSRRSAWYIGYDNHALPIGDLYAATDARPFAPAGGRRPDARGRASSRAWLGPRKSTQRRLYVRSRTSLRARALSAFPTAGEEKMLTEAALGGIETLDGTLFVPVAGLTFEWLGWDKSEGRSVGLGRFPDGWMRVARAKA
ncbi:hypothetical protein H4582DRAFT_2080104 [Lactarius indigo]|nr:hypothetical protein H4582DRAFT_2080104 [Lactarius indigo]